MERPLALRQGALERKCPYIYRWAMRPLQCSCLCLSSGHCYGPPVLEAIFPSVLDTHLSRGLHTLASAYATCLCRTQPRLVTGKAQTCVPALCLGMEHAREKPLPAAQAYMAQVGLMKLYRPLQSRLPCVFSSSGLNKSTIRVQAQWFF